MNQTVHRERRICEQGDIVAPGDEPASQGPCFRRHAARHVAGHLTDQKYAHRGLGFGLPVLAVGGTIALSALLNLTVSLGRPASARIDDREATIFLAFDILQLAVLLYLTGGLAPALQTLLPDARFEPDLVLAGLASLAATAEAPTAATPAGLPAPAEGDA